MELLLFFWEKVIVPAPAIVIDAIFFCAIIGLYLLNKAEHKKMVASITSVRRDLEGAKNEYANKAEIEPIWRELRRNTQSLETGMSSIQAQLTTISAAVIGAVGKK